MGSCVSGNCLAVSFPAWFDGGIVVCGNCLAVDDFCGVGII